MRIRATGKLKKPSYSLLLLLLLVNKFNLPIQKKKIKKQIVNKNCLLQQNWTVSLLNTLVIKMKKKPKQQIFKPFKLF